MSQFQLNKRWFHKVTDYFIPDNCRSRLEVALCNYKNANNGVHNLLNNHEHELIRALKSERRHPKIAKG